MWIGYGIVMIKIKGRWQRLSNDKMIVQLSNDFDNYAIDDYKACRIGKHVTWFELLLLNWRIKHDGKS